MPEFCLFLFLPLPEQWALLFFTITDITSCCRLEEMFKPFVNEMQNFLNNFSDLLGKLKTLLNSSDTLIKKSDLCNHFFFCFVFSWWFSTSEPAVGHTCRWRESTDVCTLKARVEKSFTSYASCGHSVIIKTSSGGELGISAIDFLIFLEHFSRLQ